MTANPGGVRDPIGAAFSPERNRIDIDDEGTFGWVLEPYSQSCDNLE
jgi:hypothetical protein